MVPGASSDCNARVTRPGASGERVAGVSRLVRPVRCERSRVAPAQSG